MADALVSVGQLGFYYGSPLTDTKQFVKKKEAFGAIEMSGLFDNKAESIILIPF